MPTRWINIGPGAGVNGHGAVNPIVAGRVTDIAVASQSRRIYLATEGGIWRSDNKGKSWRPLLDGFRLGPTYPAFQTVDNGAPDTGVSPIACGAVVCDVENPDRVYAGTGDFAAVNRGYRGVGILMSDDGGENWQREAIAGGSDNLDGAMVYAMAIDPGNREQAMAATSRGLYRRQPDGAGGFHWEQRRIHPVAGADNGLREHTTSVVVSRSGATTSWFIAQQGGEVYRSQNYGVAWGVVVGGLGGFVNPGDRLTLAVDINNPTIFYALVSTGRLLRSDLTAGAPAWADVGNFPSTANGSFGGGEGEFHQTLVIHPHDQNQVFFGGARSRTTVGGVTAWQAALYRADIAVVGGVPTMTQVNIGRAVPAYVNAICFSPHREAELWVGTDSGVFYSDKPGSIDPLIFEQRNGSLGNHTIRSLAQHPREETVLLGGTDGNGSLRYTGSEAWSAAYNADDQYSHVSNVHLGDAGYAAVNWHNPYRILVMAAPSSTTLTGAAPPGRPKALIIQTSNGGANPDPPAHREEIVTLDAGDSVQRYSPLAANPHVTGNAAEADRAAFGTRQLWVSDSFGDAGSWNKAGGILSSHIRSITFASFTRIYVGTMQGEVYRFDHGGAAWAATRLDTQPGLPSGAAKIQHPVTAIAVDPGNADRIYIAFGGAGVHDRLWFYDGANWASRQNPAAPAANQLPQTQANAVVVDPDNPTNVYVGTDLGIWQSTDSGGNWAAFNEGLPEVPVLHLLFHSGSRLLRAATLGRGVYERRLAVEDTAEVKLLVRDHQVDSGYRTDFVLPQDDPTDDNANPGARRQVTANTSPDIKVDTPDANLAYVIEEDDGIDFAGFSGVIPDDAASVGVPGDPAIMNIVSRVYLQVHNKGTAWAHRVRAALLIARMDGGVPDLPNDYQLEFQRGELVSGNGWHTVGQHVLDDVRPGAPAAVRFDLSSDFLVKIGTVAAGTQYRLLALLTHEDDVFNAEERNPETLAVAEAKAAGKTITAATLVAGPVPTAPARVNSWKPIGPATARRGQGFTSPVVSGRVPDLAIAPDGRRIYAATSNAGVWRSDDRGEHWYSTMKGFDLDPEMPAGRGAVDTMAIGAVAIDENNPDRVYVGTGEAFHGYLGTGPLVSDDGGLTWRRERSDAPLMGFGFYAIAVDPADPERAVAATTNGIFRREPIDAGSSVYHWVRKAVPGPPAVPGAANLFTSMVVARQGGQTSFFAARHGGDIYESINGHAWLRVPAYPTPANTNRVMLAVQRGNINTLFAFNELGNVHVNTRPNAAAAWTGWNAVTNVPTAAGPPPNLPQDQLWYDMALEVSPANVNTLFIASSTTQAAAGDPWSAATFRLQLTGTNVTNTNWLGASTHADVHRLRFRPGSSRELWLGCDGGVYYAADANASGNNVFVHKNTGIQSLETQHLGVHPRSEAVLFVGTQDNGGLRYTGEETWLHVTPGDGGHAVVDRNNPHNYLITYNNRVMRGSSVGRVWDSALDPTVVVPAHPAGGDQQLFYAPLEVASSGNSQFLAYGSRALWVSANFGGAWNSNPLLAPLIPANLAGSRIRSLRVVSPTMVYAGTLDGQVLRYTRPGPAAPWAAPTQLHTSNDAASGNPFTTISRGNPITSIFVDPADASNNSIYVTLGGNVPAAQRLWHFNAATGTWGARTGAAPNALPNSTATVVTVDPSNNNHIYVGTDIGVWRSTDGGATWRPFSNRLPDTTVRDLEWHQGGGIQLLRASTYGSGVWEYLISSGGAAVNNVNAVELYLRHSQLGGGREGVATQYGAGWADPLDTGTPPANTTFGSSPDIKINIPDNNGAYIFDDLHTPTFVQFVDQLPIPTAAAKAVVHRQPIVNRVYLQVHNRGIVPADDVQVVLLIGTRTAANVPANLPADWKATILSGGQINTADWKTVGSQSVSGVRAGLPRVVRFDLTSAHLPTWDQLPAQQQRRGLLAIVYQRRWDPLLGTAVNVQTLCNNHRQFAYKTITVERFTGTLPRPAERLPSYTPNLLSVIVAMLTNQKLRDLDGDLQLKMGTAGAPFKDTERRIREMAHRAADMFAAGAQVNAPAGIDFAQNFSKFAFMGTLAWDLVDFGDILSPNVGWAGDVMRRGTPDAHLSKVLVASSQFAIRAGEIAVSKVSKSQDRQKIQAFTMGMLATLAAQVVCNPILRGMAAGRNTIDWDHNRIGIDDYAVSLWISKNLLNDIPAGGDWRNWWPDRSEVPDQLFEGFAEALREVYNPESLLGQVFADALKGDTANSLPSADDIADGYRLYLNAQTGGMGAGIWFLILSPFLLMPGISLLIALAMPNAKHLLTVSDTEPDERAWYELYLTSMALGSLFPFIYGMVLWGILPKSTSYGVQALLFGLTRFAFGIAAFATTDAKPAVRWGVQFTFPTSFDVYYLVRTIVSAAKGNQGDARLWWLQAFSLMTAASNLLFALTTFKINRKENWVFWVLWVIYTLGVWLGAGIPTAIGIERGGGLLRLFRNRVDPDRPDLGSMDPRALFTLARSRAAVFDDSLLWEQGGSALANKRYPSGKRAIIKLRAEHDDMHIKHDRDHVVIKRGADETDVPLNGPLTPQQIADALAAVDGVLAEVYEAEDPSYPLPAPDMLADPGDSESTMATHDAKSDDFVALSTDEDHPYLLRHAPRSAMITRLGKSGTASSHDDFIDLLPRSATGNFDGTAVDMAADLASLLCMGAVPSVNGAAINVAGVAANPQLPKVYEVFRHWNLDERRINEWKMLVSGGADADANATRPRPSGNANPAPAGETVAHGLGWVPLVKAWKAMATDRHADSSSQSRHARAPFYRADNTPARQPKNAELTEAMRFLLDLPA
ncbi:MAG: hypothetical protein JSW26_00015 [Desulfobacterales bacterium]|nr:MAG: hypothetical protein JSW26_00015 [Desulfobacterales bacterium]